MKRQIFLGSLLCILAICMGLLIYEVLLKAGRYQLIESPYASLLAPYRWIAVGACVLTLALAALRWRRHMLHTVSPATIAFPMRGCAYMLLLAFAASSVAYAWEGFEFSKLAVRSVFLSTLLLGLSVWTTLLLLLPERLFLSPRGAIGFIDATLSNVVIVLVAVEFGLSLYARLSPTQLLWDEDSIVSYIEAKRLRPGTPYFDFRINSHGFHDREFFRADKDDVVVALLADSFGVGVVPYEYNFATVAEKALAAKLSEPGRCVAVHNFGVGGIDMTGYAWLLENEVPATNPTLVVLSVFVGNDISGFEKRKFRYNFQSLQVYKVARRLLAVQRETAAGGRIHEIGVPSGDQPRYVPGVEHERPSMSKETFLNIERERFEKCNTRDAKIERNYKKFFDALEFFRQRLGERLLVVVIPDEYQVNDELYAAILQRVSDPNAYDREYPQKRILGFCRDKGMRCLDLLDTLKEAQKEDRVYHLRDTHWNARGNRVAGDAIAQYILAH